MTYLVERLAELRLYLGHLASLRGQAVTEGRLERDLSIRNDVLFSPLTVCQLVIDVAGELAGRRGARFEDYTEAIRSLAADQRFPGDLVRQLEPLAGFRNVLIHEYVQLDLGRVIRALDELAPIERFFAIVTEIEAAEGDDSPG